MFLCVLVMCGFLFRYIDEESSSRMRMVHYVGMTLASMCAHVCEVGLSGLWGVCNGVVEGKGVGRCISLSLSLSVCMCVCLCQSSCLFVCLSCSLCQSCSVRACARISCVRTYVGLSGLTGVCKGGLGRRIRACRRASWGWGVAEGAVGSERRDYYSYGLYLDLPSTLRVRPNNLFEQNRVS